VKRHGEQARFVERDVRLRNPRCTDDSGLLAKLLPVCQAERATAGMWGRPGPFGALGGFAQ